jgi:hypothetical protein
MCTETANAQELVGATIKKSATTSSRGGLGERPPQILTLPASPRGGNRAHKKILFFSFLAAPIPTAHTKLVGAAIKKSDGCEQ